MIQSLTGLLIMAIGLYLIALFTTKAVIPECKAGYPEILLPATCVYAVLFGFISLGYSVFTHTI